MPPLSVNKASRAVGTAITTPLLISIPMLLACCATTSMIPDHRSDIAIVDSESRDKDILVELIGVIKQSEVPCWAVLLYFEVDGKEPEIRVQSGLVARGGVLQNTVVEDQQAAQPFCMTCKCCRFEVIRDVLSLA